MQLFTFFCKMLTSQRETTDTDITVHLCYDKSVCGRQDVNKNVFDKSFSIHINKYINGIEVPLILILPNN